MDKERGGRMSDLISREEAIEAIEEYVDRLQMVSWKENPNVPYKVYSLNWCINTIRDLPTIDAVPVIRCKDCKHRPTGSGANHDVVFPSGDYKCPCRCDDHWYSWIPDDDWFCANGEVKEE